MDASPSRTCGESDSAKRRGGGKRGGGNLMPERGNCGKPNTSYFPQRPYTHPFPVDCTPTQHAQNEARARESQVPEREPLSSIPRPARACPGLRARAPRAHQGRLLRGHLPLQPPRQLLQRRLARSWTPPERRLGGGRRPGGLQQRHPGVRRLPAARRDGAAVRDREGGRWILVELSVRRSAPRLLFLWHHCGAPRALAPNEGGKSEGSPSAGGAGGGSTMRSSALRAFAQARGHSPHPGSARPQRPRNASPNCTSAGTARGGIGGSGGVPRL